MQLRAVAAAHELIVHLAAHNGIPGIVRYFARLLPNGYYPLAPAGPCSLRAVPTLRSAPGRTSNKTTCRPRSHFLTFDCTEPLKR